MSVVTEANRWSIDLAGLRRALQLLLLVFLPIAVLTGLLWTSLYLVLRLDGRRGDFFQQNYLTVILWTQRDRIQATHKASLAIFGDSACLMGVHVPTLRKRFGDKIESFCSVAPVGPAGYAHMLDKLIERGATPERVLLVMHPYSFAREPSWDHLTNLVAAGTYRIGPRAANVLRYARLKWSDRVLYRPIPEPGNAQFYGGYSALSAFMHREHGSALDPQAVLNVPSLAEFERLTSTARRPSTRSYPYLRNAAFNTDLERLANTVGRVGSDRVHLIIPPVADINFSSESELAYSAAAKDIADRLKIPAANIVPVEGYMPLGYFSTETHLNRWGRVLYTEKIASHLRHLFAEPARQSRQQ